MLPRQRPEVQTRPHRYELYRAALSANSFRIKLLTRLQGPDTHGPLVSSPPTLSSSPTQTSSAPPRITSHSSLSTGAKAGIGVGASIGGILCLLALGCIFFRQNMRFATKSVKGHAPATNLFEKPELAADTIPPKGEPRNLEGQTFELDGTQPVELDGYQVAEVEERKRTPPPETEQ